MFVAVLGGCHRDSGSGPAQVAGATDNQRALYAYGQSLAAPIRALHLSPDDAQWVQKGMSDALLGQTAMVAVENAGARVQAISMARAAASAAANKKQGDQVAAKALSQPGAKRLPSGVIYQSIRHHAGTGPGPEDAVTVHYRGYLADGTEFDSTYQRGAPARFSLANVIPCWSDGIQQMSVGDEAKLTCPAELAYGDVGNPPSVPGGAVLSFDLMLVNIERAGAARSGHM